MQFCARHVLVHVAARRCARRQLRWTWPASPTSPAGSTRSASDVITDEGYFYHKYNPDGSPASSWHPWVLKGSRSLPIQEDETALVVWALWRHYYRYRDIEFIRPLWVDVVQKAADFMVQLPRPAHRPAAAELRPVGRALGRPRVHRRDGLRRPEGRAKLRGLLRRSRARPSATTRPPKRSRPARRSTCSATSSTASSAGWCPRTARRRRTTRLSTRPSPLRREPTTRRAVTKSTRRSTRRSTRSSSSTSSRPTTRASSRP